MQKRKLDKLTSLYVIVAVLVAVMSIFSFTFAWYIKTSTAYLNITFAPPIVIDINNKAQVVTPIDGNIKAMMPGSSFSINLGLSMPEGSSTAYVRAKMSVEFEDVYDSNNQLVRWDEYVSVDTAISTNWVKVDFSRDPAKEDIWYVCKASAGSDMISREVSPGDTITFANGMVFLSLDIDNKFADKDINVVFIVESLQTVGVSDPLAGGVSNAKYHEVWGSA